MSKDRRLNILHSFGIRWPDVMDLLYVMKETGGNPHGTPIEKAAFHFREYVSLDMAEEREMLIKKGRLCPDCDQPIIPGR